MPASAETRVAAVVGCPVRHSLSPAIMNAAFAATGLDWVCTAFEVPSDRGAGVVEAMRALGLVGLSVTMPHKAVISATVDERTPVAAALDSVNCVFWADDRLVGDNTDAAGFLDSLRLDHDLDPSGRRCVVVGAGGAGRAVCWALGDAGAAEVVVINRTSDHAKVAAALAGDVGRVGEATEIRAADVVVNATPVGMGDRQALPFDPELIQPGQVVVDLIYHPLTTPLLAAAVGRGARSVSGLGMLVHQGARAFHRWTGHEPPVEVMSQAALAALAGRA